MTPETYEHRQAAKMHCNACIRNRLNRIPFSLDIVKMKLALVNDNHPDCFIRRPGEGIIKGIVKFQNIHTVATFDKHLGVVVSVGGEL